VRFIAERKIKYGMLTGESIQGIEGKPFRPLKFSDHYYPLSEVKLLSPCMPSKIVAVGLNYRSHARELNSPLPETPLLFLKPSTAVIGPEDNIVYPPSSARVDYEGELGVVIKKPAWQVSLKEAPSFVLGYTCFNDVTARDLQRKDGQFTRGKGFDTFCPVGPWIVPRERVDFERLRVRTFVNGEKKQDASVQEMIFPVGAIIAFVTQFMTLEPGDLIASGTPAGVGPLEPGDVVRVEIDGLGVLENRVVRG